MPYNPFDKPIGDKLTATDLQQLIEHDVSEGYYVEYKGDFPANQKIGHSIASFANTYGGWYIVGVKTDAHHRAKEIFGFSLKANPDPISKVRDVTKSHIDPVPIFYPQIVNLDEDRAVLVVYVPGGQETPFVSKDGRIYRRNHDSSDPVPETSRYTVDRLVDYGRNVARLFEKFYTDERSFSKSEEDQGWVKLFLSPYPLGIIEKRLMVSNESLDKLLELSRTELKIRAKESAEWASGNLPFNSAQPTYQSVILRQIAPAKAAFNSLTAELFFDGRAKFFIPLHYFPPLRTWRSGLLESSEVRETLGKLLKADQELHIDHLRFFDIAQLWLSVACLLSYYQEWLGEQPLLTDLQVGVRIEGVWRSVPFFDSRDWAAYVENFTLPVMPCDSVSIPQDLGQGLWMSFVDELPLWFEICSFVGLGFGLTSELCAYTVVQAVEKAAKTKKGG